MSERKDLLATQPEEVGFIKKTTTIVKTVDANVAPEDNNKFIQVIRPLLVELLGTTLFILIGLWGTCGNGGHVAAGLAFGLTFMVFSAGFGHISGVHFNPAITIGVLIAGEMQAVMAILYGVMQLLGGIAAGGILRLLLATNTYQACNGGATLLHNATHSVHGDFVRIWQGIFIEFIVTFVLVTVVLMVALDTKSKTGLAPLLIGFTWAVSILAVAEYTDGSLNPARSLGPAIFSNHWENHFVYWIGPLAGAIVAGFLYRAVWAHYDRRMFVKRTTTTTAVKA